MVRTLNIVGAGHVGRTLGRLLHAHAVFEVQDVLTRSLASARDAVAFIGAGRLASGLALALHAAGMTVTAVASRSAQSARQLAALISECDATDAQSAVDQAQLVFITTPDDVSVLALKRAGKLNFRPRVAQVALEAGDVIMTGTPQGVAIADARTEQTRVLVEAKFGLPSALAMDSAGTRLAVLRAAKAGEVAVRLAKTAMATTKRMTTDMESIP